MSEWTANELKHLNSPFYKEAKALVEQVRVGQILKGSDKYEEPYNPENYTAEEQLMHILEENVDQQHYAVGLYKTIKKLEAENRELKVKIEGLLSEMKRREMWKDG